MSKKPPPPLKPAFIERMQTLFPNKKDFDSYLKILEQEPVRSIRCNTLKISPEKLKPRLEKKGWKISQPWKNHPEVMIVEGRHIHSHSQRDKDNTENSVNSTDQLTIDNKSLSLKNSERSIVAKSDAKSNQYRAKQDNL